MDLLSKAIEGWSKHKPISYQKSVNVDLMEDSTKSSVGFKVCLFCYRFICINTGLWILNFL